MTAKDPTDPDDDVELAAWRELKRIGDALHGLRQLLENSLDQDGCICVRVVNAGWTEDVEVSQ